MNEKKYYAKIKSITYLLIPSICFGFWAILNLIRIKFVLPENLNLENFI